MTSVDRAAPCRSTVLQSPGCPSAHGRHGLPPTDRPGGREREGGETTDRPPRTTRQARLTAARPPSPGTRDTRHETGRPVSPPTHTPTTRHIHTLTEATGPGDWGADTQQGEVNYESIGVSELIYLLVVMYVFYVYLFLSTCNTYGECLCVISSGDIAHFTVFCLHSLIEIVQLINGECQQARHLVSCIVNSNFSRRFKIYFNNSSS